MVHAPDTVRRGITTITGSRLKVMIKTLTVTDRGHRCDSPLHTAPVTKLERAARHPHESPLENHRPPAQIRHPAATPSHPKHPCADSPPTANRQAFSNEATSAARPSEGRHDASLGRIGVAPAWKIEERHFTDDVGPARIVHRGHCHANRSYARTATTEQARTALDRDEAAACQVYRPDRPLRTANCTETAEGDFAGSYESHCFGVNGSQV